MRQIICILLLLCLPLQSFALHAGFGQLSHAVDSGKGFHHHHNDDGSVQYDDSDESLNHSQEHSCAQQPANFNAPRLPAAPEQVAAAVQPEAPGYIPEPFLEGPHRPPALALGQAAGGIQHT